MMLVDIGTNAEIVLGNAARIVAASSPTGPASEGAEISSGQRAAPRRDRAGQNRPRDAGAALAYHRIRALPRMPKIWA